MFNFIAVMFAALTAIAPVAGIDGAVTATPNTGTNTTQETGSNVAVRDIDGTVYYLDEYPILNTDTWEDTCTIDESKMCVFEYEYTDQIIDGEEQRIITWVGEERERS